MTEKPLSERLATITQLVFETYDRKEKAFFADDRPVVLWSDVELAVARLKKEINRHSIPDEKSKRIRFVEKKELIILIDEIFGVMK